MAGMSLRLLAIILLQLVVACVSSSTPPAQPHPTAPAPEASASAAPQPEARVPQPSSVELPIEPDDIVWGSPTAPVTLVEFIDLQCPFCARTPATLAALMEHYGPEKLRIVIKHHPLPFHERALEAARFAQAVTELGGSKAGFRFVERALRAPDALERARLIEYVRELGLDPARVEALADSFEVANAIARDVALAKRVGALGTPGFFANGVRIMGAQPLEVFRRHIEAELAKAAELSRAGTPPDQIFATLVARDLRPEPEPEPEAAPPPEQTVWRVPVSGAPAKGARKPLVTIVEFTDFQCPFCKRAQATLQRILERYPDDVRLVVRHNPMPFHHRARAAATLAIEARAQRGDAAFFDVADRIFERAPDLDEEALLEIAREFKLNVARVKAALAQGRHDRVIEEDVDLASDLQARGVPYFFINGVQLAGAQPLDAFIDAVEREREKASALIAAGTPRDKVYAKIMEGAREPDPPEQRKVAVPADSPSRGPANAPVTIQVFSDFQCPYCKRAEATLFELDRKYPGQIRWVFRNFPLPFHKQARPAARAALEARAQKGDKAFWTMHDRLFAAQDVEGGLSEQNILAIARDMGLDLDRFRAALESDVHDAAIERDTEAAREAGINGTPTFLINDYYLSGAQPIGAFEKLVKRAKADRKRP